MSAHDRSSERNQRFATAQGSSFTLNVPTLLRGCGASVIKLFTESALSKANVRFSRRASNVVLFTQDEDASKPFCVESTGDDCHGFTFNCGFVGVCRSSNSRECAFAVIRKMVVDGRINARPCGFSSA